MLASCILDSRIQSDDTKCHDSKGARGIILSLCSEGNDGGGLEQNNILDEYVRFGDFFYINGIGGMDRNKKEFNQDSFTSFLYYPPSCKFTILFSITIITLLGSPPNLPTCIY